MEENHQETNEKNYLLTVFIDLYSIPSFYEIIKETKTDSEEQIERIKEVKLNFDKLYTYFKIIYSFDEVLTPNRYDWHIKNLKAIFLDSLLQANQKKPAFLIINELYSKLDSKYIDLCERLMIDLVTKIKEDEMKDEVRAYLADFFKKYDSSGDGVISLSELEQHLNLLGLPSSMAQEIMTNADTSNDGLIGFDEFENYFKERVLENYKLFYNLDSDNDKKLNYSQVRQALHELYPNLKMPEDVYHKLFNTIDQDKSGLVSFSEWSEFLLMFPTKNLENVVEKWKLFSLTAIDPQEFSSPFFEEDLLEATEKEYSIQDLMKTFFCGGISGALSKTMTAPLERLKIFYQTMYQDSKPPSAIKGLVDVYKQQGFLALFRGNSISVAMSCVEQALRFGIIEYSKLHFENENGIIEPHEYIFIGLITSILSTIVIFPMEVVRVRVITSEGEKHKVYNKIKKIIATNGYRGFYTGLIPHMMTVLPAGTMNVLFYNILRKYFVYESDSINPKIGKFMMIGGTAGLITGTLTYPLSLITSRMIVASRNLTPNSEKIGLLGFIKQIFYNEGIGGFFKGYKTSMMRVIIGQSINFGTYETLKSRIKKRNQTV